MSLLLQPGHLQGGLAQRIASGPHHGAAAVLVKAAGLRVAITKRDTARSVTLFAGGSNRIFARLRYPGALRSGLAGLFALITQNRRSAACDECAEIRRARNMRALRQDHFSILSESNVGDFASLGFAGEIKLLVRGQNIEAAVRIQADGPDLRTLGDRIIEAALIHSDAPHPPSRSGQAPGVRVGGLELFCRYVCTIARVERCNIEIVCAAACNPMVEVIERFAIHIHPVDEPRIPVGNEELAVLLIEGDVAERRTAVGLSVIGNVCK